MSRGDRLLELADQLRARESTTVEALAEELGVSRRTVLRDLGALRERGMPISGETGPGGGVRLDRDRGIAAVHMAFAEIVSLWLAARLSQGASTLPWGGAASSGMAKLLASIPREKARALRALCRRVMVGPPASTQIREGAGQAPPELLAIFEEAFSAGIGLGFIYTDRERRESHRRVEPHGLLVETPVWYVIARDIDIDKPRTFRMDRIERPRLLRRVSFRPDVRVIDAQLTDRDRWRPLTGSW
jgi:predicted DNA-binding transcriptional regulator YafY